MAVTVSVLSLLSFLVTRLDGGDVLGTLASTTQASIFALQILRISYLLYALGRIVVAALWKWLGRVRVGNRPGLPLDRP